MDWLLTIVFLSIPGEPALTVGHMLDARTCRIAGGGMAQVLQAANPGQSIGWRCRHRGVAM